MAEESNKKINEDSEDLKKRILELELEQARIKSHIVSLRGLVNKKLGGFDKEEMGTPKIEEKKEEDLNKTVFLSPNGTPL